MKLLMFLLLVMFVVTPGFAQQSCPALVTDALALLEEVCATTARNELCYGHTLVSATTITPDVTFTQPGDRVSLLDLASIQTSSMIMPDVWGIAFIRMQANLPGTLPGQNVSILLLGDVELRDASQPTDGLPASNRSTINLRAGPSTNHAIITAVQANSPIDLIGRNASSDWVYGVLSNGSGWLSAPLLAIEGDVSTLAIVADDYAPFHALQAFYFRSGIGDSQCAEAPDSGIVIQTPVVEAPVALRINDVDIRLGSTIYLQAEPEGEMELYVLEGQAEVTAQQITQIVAAGQVTSVALDADSHAISAPEEPRDYKAEQLEALPEIPVFPAEVPEGAAAPHPTAAAPAAGGSIAGSWTSIDTDGSIQHLTITAIGGGVYEFDYTDEGASVCGKDANNRPLYPAHATMRGSLQGNSVTADLAIMCLGGSDVPPWTVTATFSYNVAEDTLSDSWGIRWTRG
jgi:quercetin dioxygenase-like cupin family protein